MEENSDFWTGKCENVINVSAVEANGAKSDYTNYSDTEGIIDISAPGMAPGAVLNGTEVEVENGTSFAAPMVTSTVAVMKAINPDLTAKEIKEIIRKTANKNVGEEGYDKRLGNGILQMDQAVLKVINRVREKEGEAPIDAETFFEQSAISLKLEKSGDNYILQAKVEELFDSSVDLTLETSQDAVKVAEDKQATLSSPQTVTWTLQSEEEATVKVVRSDTGYCSYVTLMPFDFEGTWTGTFDDTEGSLPLGIVITEKGDEYHCEASLYPEYIFGDEAIRENGFNDDSIFDYQTAKEFVELLLQPRFSNFTVEEEKISFVLDLTVNMFGETQKVHYQFEGKIESEDVILGDVTNTTEGMNGNWGIKKGMDGIRPYEEDFIGFWE
ncbi:MAG TPA: hypothetical protein DHN33_09710 [Eubacteriaceae bacterium]|nr:hypothetical protein [Eubacteriaceae bacterium]